MPPPRIATQPDRVASDDDVGAGSVIAALWRQRVTALVVFVLSIALGVAYLAIAPARYQASTSILLDPRLGKTVGADPTVPGFVADSSAIDSQVRLLTSQTVLSRVAANLHLEDDPEFSGSKFSISRFLGLAPPALPGADLKALENAITIKKPERTYLVEIQVMAASADKAAGIANGIADAYNEDQVSSRVVSTRNDAKFVAQKRRQLRKQIADAEQRIEAYKTENNIVSTDGLRSNEQQVADLTRELGTSRGRLSELKARADQVAAIAKAGKLDSSADALKSATIDRLRGAQAESEREFAKLAETLGPRHPAYLEAQAQTQRVRELIGAELGRLRQSAENDYQAEKRNETQLLADVDRIKRLSTDTSSKLLPLRQLERDVDALRASDERFARIGDTLTQQEGDTPPARIIAAARPPVSPSWPRKSLVLGIAAGVGLFFGVGAALLRDNLSRPARPKPLTAPVEAAPAVARRRAYWADEAPQPERVEPDAKPIAPRRNAVQETAPVIEPEKPRAHAARSSQRETDDGEDEDYYSNLRRRRRPRRLVWS